MYLKATSDTLVRTKLLGQLGHHRHPCKLSQPLTLNPYMLVMQALHVLQRPWRDREKFEPLRRVTSLRALAIMSHELLPSALRDAAGAISR